MEMVARGLNCDAVCLPVAHWRDRLHAWCERQGYKEVGGHAWPSEKDHQLSRHTVLMQFKKTLSAGSPKNQSKGGKAAASGAAGAGAAAPTGAAAMATGMLENAVKMQALGNLFGGMLDGVTFEATATDGSGSDEGGGGGGSGGSSGAEAGGGASVFSLEGRGGVSVDCFQAQADDDDGGLESLVKGLTSALKTPEGREDWDRLTAAEPANGNDGNDGAGGGADGGLGELMASLESGGGGFDALLSSLSRGGVDGAGVGATIDMTGMTAGGGATV
jgi:hypothetical protein